MNLNPPRRFVQMLLLAPLVLMLMTGCGTIPQTSIETRGASWCDIMQVLGGKLSLSRSDALTPETHRHILTVNQYGMDHCGWK